MASVRGPRHTDRVPIYVAFLRAINLGATRKFPKAAIVAATEAAGGADVATHIASGNVRLTSSMRSIERVRTALEASYAAAAGFEVPVIAFTPAELRMTARAYHTQAKLYPGMAHDMMLEKDWQQVADRVIEWLGEDR